MLGTVINASHVNIIVDGIFFSDNSKLEFTTPRGSSPSICLLHSALLELVGVHFTGGFKREASQMPLSTTVTFSRHRPEPWERTLRE